MKMRHASFAIFTTMLLVVTIMVGLVVMFALLQDPQALDKILAFVLEQVRQ